MSKITNHHKRGNRLKYFGLFAVLNILVILLVVKILSSKPVLKPRVTYHGPNPITMRREMESESVLGKSAPGQRKKIGKITPTAQSPTPTIPKPTPTGLPPTPTIQPQLPTPIPSLNKGEYGIAAGGGLTYLGQTDLDLYFNNLQSLGVKWVRWDIDWSVIQSNGVSDFRWEETDRVAATAKKYGINSLGIITYTPKWARDSVCVDKFSCQPADPKVFAVFAGKVALRYKDLIIYWEIWNEPNVPNFWTPKPNVMKYFDILREAYWEVKKNNPQSIILSGGLAPSGDEADGSISPFTFMSALYTAGANQYFDAVALHPYTYPISPDYQASWNHWKDLVSVHQIMVDNGDVAKKIWITEFGAATGGPGVPFPTNQPSGFKYNYDFMTEGAQYDMLVEATTYYVQNTDWMGPFFWYSLHDNGTSKETPENFFGLLRYDWSKKPAYDTYRNAILAGQ